MTPTDEQRVRKVEDTRVEVPQEYAETRHATDPLLLRPGVDDGKVMVGSEFTQVTISDLRTGLDLIEAELRS